MTESEVIEILRFAYPKESNRPITEEVISIAINALEEIQQYKELGTVEALRVAKEKQIPKKPNDEIKTIPVIDEDGAYVDADTYVYLLCPICGNQVGIDDCIDNYCSDCGQKLDWSDEE